MLVNCMLCIIMLPNHPSKSIIKCQPMKIPAIVSKLLHTLFWSSNLKKLRRFVFCHNYLHIYFSENTSCTEDAILQTILSIIRTITNQNTTIFSLHISFRPALAHFCSVSHLTSHYIPTWCSCGHFCQLVLYIVRILPDCLHHWRVENTGLMVTCQGRKTALAVFNFPSLGSENDIHGTYVTVEMRCGAKVD